MLWLAALMSSLVGYLLGSVSFAIVVSRAFGLADPRSFGSGNPGATNVLRTGSKVAAALTLAGDALKGAVAVWWVGYLAPMVGLGEAAPWLALCAGLGAFVGHLYPIYFRFVGGKGVATFLGVIAAAEPMWGLIAAGVWVAMALAFRYSSLASVSAALAVAVAQPLLGQPDRVSVILAGMAGLLIYRHRHNVQRLWAGTEAKLGKKA